jgi:2-iminobutanoate/2-iminopropanoate deaminase
MCKEEIYTPKVAKTKQPYCQGMSVKASRLIFTSGTTARNPSGEIIAKGDIRGQTRQVLDNIIAVLAEAGASPKDIFKMTVYLRRNEDYNGMNEIRQEYFRKDTFVSTTVITELHAQDALVEIEVAAAVE